jgi:UDP-glucuronate decarboxylase
MNELYRNVNEKTFLITGATGFVGSMLCKYILRANQESGNSNIVIACGRNSEKLKKVFKDYLNVAELQFYVGDIKQKIEYLDEIDYIFHCASVTSSKYMITYPVETISASVIGTQNMLDLAREKKVEAFVYISSMEMYGKFETLDHDVTEADLGYVDPLVIRSNYPESKRMCENMCIAYMSEYNVPVRIARLAQTFGEGILPGENRVFAQFAKSVVREEDIILHTRGLSEGNYCYILDCVEGLITIALKGSDGEAYNVSNPDTHTTIADMAQMVCKEIAKDKIKVIYDIPESNTFGYASDTKMKLDSTKLQMLGWKPKVGLKESYERLIEYIRKNEI